MYNNKQPAGIQRSIRSIQHYRRQLRIRRNLR